MINGHALCSTHPAEFDLGAVHQAMGKNSSTAGSQQEALELCRGLGDPTGKPMRSLIWSRPRWNPPAHRMP